MLCGNDCQSGRKPAPSQKCKLVCIGVNSSMGTAEVMDIHHEIVFISSFMVSQLLIRKFTVSPGGDDCPGRGESLMNN